FKGVDHGFYVGIAACTELGLERIGIQVVAVPQNGHRGDAQLVGGAYVVLNGPEELGRAPFVPRVVEPYASAVEVEFPGVPEVALDDVRRIAPSARIARAADEAVIGQRLVRERARGGEQADEERQQYRFR